MNIGALVVTANQVDIDAGKLAASMGSTSDVKKLGEQMVKDHTGAARQGASRVPGAPGARRRRSASADSDTRSIVRRFRES